MNAIAKAAAKGEVLAGLLNLEAEDRMLTLNTHEVAFGRLGEEDLCWGRDPRDDQRHFDTSSYPPRETRAPSKA
jgi:hypothetical protein